MAIGAIDSSMANMQQMVQMSQASRAQRFERADSNGDGGIDKTELSGVTVHIEEMSGQSIDVEALISENDADNDGLLNEDEMEQAMTSLRESMPEPSFSGAPSMGGAPPMGGGPPMGGAPPMGEESGAASGVESDEEDSYSLLDIYASLTEEAEESESSIVDLLYNSNALASYSSVENAMVQIWGTKLDLES